MTANNMGANGMRVIIGFMVAILLAFGLGLALRPSTTTASAAAACTISGFEATVRKGLSAGTSFAGSLALQEDDDGALTGTFDSTDGKLSAQVVGQANGHAINLAIDLGNRQHLFVVGTMWSTFAGCTGAMGGPFVGPQIGDIGDWSVQ
jgi:hypothetical protein